MPFCSSPPGACAGFNPFDCPVVRVGHCRFRRTGRQALVIRQPHELIGRSRRRPLGWPPVARGVAQLQGRPARLAPRFPPQSTFRPVSGRERPSEGAWCCAPARRTSRACEPWRRCRATERHTAHQQRSTDATIYYRFHPLRTNTLPVIRRYHVGHEPYYVVLRADGTPLAVPGWMTRPEAAYAEVVRAVRVPIRVLRELHRVAVACLSSRHNADEEDPDVAAPTETPTTTLRRPPTPSRRPTSPGRTSAVTPRPGAVDAGPGEEASRGERR